MLTRMLRRKSPLVIGLDISDREIRACVLKKSHNKFLLVANSRALLEPQAVVAKEIRNITAVSQTLKQLLTRLPVIPTFAVAALADHSIIYNNMFVDSTAGRAEIEAEILLSITKQLPSPLQEITIDYQVLNKNLEGKQQIFYTGALAHLIASYTKAIKEAGMRLAVVDVESQIISRTILLPEKIDNLTIFCVLPTRTLFMVRRNNNVVFTHSELIHDDFYSLRDSLKRSLQLFTVSNHYQAVEKIHLMSPFTKVVDHSQTLSLEVAIPVVELKPELEKIILSDDSQQTLPLVEYFMSIALALRGFVL